MYHENTFESVTVVSTDGSVASFDDPADAAEHVHMSATEEYAEKVKRWLSGDADSLAVFNGVGHVDYWVRKISE